MIQFIVSTFADSEAASRVARSLVEESLAACGTLLPGATSIYRWQGTVEQATEVVLLLKTADKTADACRKRLAQLHPYEVPEIVSLSPSGVAAAYGGWVVESCSAGPAE